MKFIVSIMQLN